MSSSASVPAAPLAVSSCSSSSRSSSSSPAFSSRPLFALGRLLATPGALHLLARYQISVLALLSRHVRGDWGELCAEDRQANVLALEQGLRLLSCYPLNREEGGQTVSATLWVITEADRASTTVLLPSEY